MEQFNDSLDELYVKDEESWKAYLEMKSSEIFTDTFISDDDGNLWDVRSVKPSEVMHLSVQLRDRILARKALYTSTLKTLMKMRDKALGVSSALSFSSATIYAEDITQLAGAYYSFTEIRDILRTRHNVVLPINSIRTICDKFQTTIKRLQSSHASDVSSVRLSHKKSRLEELTHLYLDRKSRYDQGKKAEDYKLLLATLDHIRKETDGDKIELSVTGGLEITHQVSAHIRAEVLREVSILDIIIGRVAAKSGIDPKYLISRLQRSIYAKFTGMAQPDNDPYSDDIPLPPPTYNFEAIEKIHDSRPEIERLEVSHVDEKQEQLRQLLINLNKKK